uniref:RING-type E3 ubiquitin transferase n=1 Tax=Tetraodon nigroviridis TaxID=99883 RepID=H3D5A3_TETNG
ERRRQAERLQREEAYYHFINDLSEEEYRLMRDGNLLGTPGEVTAEELQQRLDGAKERMSSQPRNEHNLRGTEPGAEASNGDSLLEWLNTFRRTGNATRSGQSGNQTWRAVSRTNPNSGEFRFSLEININHDQPEQGEHNDTADAAELPVPVPASASPSVRTASAFPSPLPSSNPRPAPYSTPRPALSRRMQTRRTRSSKQQPPRVETEQSGESMPASADCPRVSPQAASQAPAAGNEARASRTRSRGRARRAAAATGVSPRLSRRSRSPLHRLSVAGHSSPSSGSIRRHPTIMLDLQVRRIRPGERDRDSIASRRSRARVAENTVTFETESGGFRRTISRSERAGIRTYVSTIRIPLRRISETGLGEPNSTALRSILRQIMTGFGELSSLMETEADSETVAPSPTSASGANANSSPVGRLGTTESATGPFDTGAVDHERMGLVVGEDHSGQARLGGAIVSTAGGRATSRDTNNLVENGTLPILRLAHFFLLNDDEDDEHPRGLTKEQIDNLATRTYGQASLEGEMGRACSVCINEYAQGNKLRRLPCSHEFHIHCIDRWLSENNTCPICRQPILTA